MGAGGRTADEIFKELPFRFKGLPVKLFMSVAGGILLEVFFTVCAGISVDKRISLLTNIEFTAYFIYIAICIWLAVRTNAYCTEVQAHIKETYGKLSTPSKMNAASPLRVIALCATKLKFQMFTAACVVVLGAALSQSVRMAVDVFLIEIVGFFVLGLHVFTKLRLNSPMVVHDAILRIHQEE